MKNSIKYYFFLFLIWPFLGFVLALKNGFNKDSQKIILAFAFIYGYSVYLYSGDILDYADSYKIIANYTWTDFWYILKVKLSQKDLIGYSPNPYIIKPDIFSFTLSFLCSRISESPRLFWGFVSLIYTWFMLLFFNEVKSSTKNIIKNYIHYTFILFLLLVIPKFVGVTGVRFWPALFLFMYFLMRYAKSKSLKKNFYLFCTGLAMLIHYTYFIPFIILIIIHFAPINKYVSKILIITSVGVFAISNNSTIFSVLESAMELSEDNQISENMESYTDQDKYNENQIKRSNTNWYVKFRANAHIYILLFMVFIEQIGVVKLKENELSSLLNPILIVFFCLTLITFELGSIGRFKNIFILLALTRYVVIYPFNVNSIFLKYSAIVLMPVLLIYTIVTFRTELYFVDPMLIVSNVFGTLLIRSSESLSEFIVGH